MTVLCPWKLNLVAKHCRINAWFSLVSDPQARHNKARLYYTINDFVRNTSISSGDPSIMVLFSCIDISMNRALNCDVGLA